MASFEIAYLPVIAKEAGYANRKADLGGETYRGVARKRWPDEPIWTLIDEAKRLPDFPRNLDKNAELHGLIKKFYWTRFWDQMRGDRIPSQAIANRMFDCFVNQGRATTYLQIGLNVLNKRGTLWPDVHVDGRMGPATLSCLQRYLELKPEKFLIAILCILQGHRYVEITLNNETQEDNLYGWLNRLSLNTAFEFDSGAAAVPVESPIG